MNYKIKKKISLLLVSFFVCSLVAIPLFFACALDIVEDKPRGIIGIGGLENPIEADSFAELIEDIIDWVAEIGIIIAVGMIIYSGVLFMIAGGRDEQITKAKMALTWSLIGLAVLLIGKNWVSLVESILGG